MCLTWTNCIEQLTVLEQVDGDSRLQIVNLNISNSLVRFLRHLEMDQLHNFHDLHTTQCSPKMILKVMEGFFSSEQIDFTL
jgi:hypothetical protein